MKSDAQIKAEAAGYSLHRLPLHDAFVILLPGHAEPNIGLDEKEHNYHGIFSPGQEQEAWEEVAEQLA